MPTHPERPLLLVLLLASLLVSCYRQTAEQADAWSLSDRQADSLAFSTTHHYSQNYNFIVKASTLQLIAQHPTEYVNGLPVDTLTVCRGERIVVADVTTMPSDTTDTTWVKVARDQQTMGWIHERSLLGGVHPDDPISQFIDVFSDTHLLLFLALLVVAVTIFAVRRIMKLGAHIVHFNDIQSFYPTLLALLTAASAVIYATIQMHAPQSWRHFYYHPTLNPLSVPLHLSLFLFTVWAIVVVALAAAFDIRRQLSGGEALSYALSLAGVCAVCYVVFSLATPFYVGYPLFALYVVASLLVWRRHRQPLYRCGRCGGLIEHKGACPHCGAVNE